MTTDLLIEYLNKIVGHRIADINYEQTKFFYPFPNNFAAGDWTKVNPDLFVLHSPEWQFKFSNGESWFITNPQGDMSIEPGKSNITISNKSKTTAEEKILKAPREFMWKDIFDKEITRFRLWKRVITSKKILGIEYDKKFQDNVQIIQLTITDKLFSITTMDGDIGSMTFYPRGYLGERLGVVFDKSIADSHTVHGITMRMEIVYDSVKQKK